MKKVFLDNLPRQGNSKRIDWKKSVGYKVKFIYGEIVGDLPILDYIIKDNRNYIITEYNDVKNFHIWIGDFPKCKLGLLLGKHKMDYIYSEGEIVKNFKNGELKILKQVRIKQGNPKRNLKGYLYKCLICGDTCEKTEDELKRNGCGVCAGNKVLKGYNDLWTTRPDVAKLLTNPNRGFELMQYSNCNECFTCPDCGNTKQQLICNVTQQGLSCSKCGDGCSYPEKLVFNVLDQLNIHFETQKKFKWSNDKKYDFYIPSLNFIIETHGEQHYRYTGLLRTLEEEQANDRLKEKLAKENRIKNYIVIDCRLSELDYIKNNVISSKLSSMYNLDIVDWKKSHEYACDSRIRLTCELWNDGNTMVEISKLLKINESTVRTYLKKGTIIGWANYDPKKSMNETYIMIGKKTARSVVQIEVNGEVVNAYESIASASRITGINGSCILGVCKRKHKTSGGYRWMYKEDYDESIKK